MTKKRKKTSKRKIRLFFAFLIFGSITAVLGYDLFANIYTIGKMKIEKKELIGQIAALNEEKELLQTDILKLEDPNYIAKYVREKYYYSKNGEYILRMDK